MNNVTTSSLGCHEVGLKRLAALNVESFAKVGHVPKKKKKSHTETSQDMAHLLLRNEPEALVEVGQSHEVAVDEVYDRLDDAVPLVRFHVTNLSQ